MSVLKTANRPERGQYFRLRSDITVNEIELTMNSLIVRHGPTTFFGSLASQEKVSEFHPGDFSALCS